MEAHLKAEPLRVTGEGSPHGMAIRSRHSIRARVGGEAALKVRIPVH